MKKLTTAIVIHSVRTHDLHPTQDALVLRIFAEK